MIEGRKSEAYKDNRFKIYPEQSVLSNMLSITEQYLMRKLVGGFRLTDMTNQLMSEGHIEDELLYPFEDVTWDTVFANLKCLEFYDYRDSPDSEQGIDSYLCFLDYIHNVDTTNLFQDAITDASQLCGFIMVNVWADVRSGLIEALTDPDFDRSNLLDVSLDIMMASIRNSAEIFASDSEGKNVFFNVVDGMQGVFYDMEINENTLILFTYASVIKGAEVLVCDPEYLPFGERLVSASKYFMAGGSMFVTEKILAQMEEPMEALRKCYGDEILAFLPSLISATICCSYIVAIDHNPMIRQLIAEFDKIPTLTYEIRQLRESAEQFEQMAAKLAGYDYEKLKTEIDGYSAFANDIERISSSEELYEYLMKYYERTGKPIPWGNRSIEEHWADPNSRLVFK